jgi:hypothetical protein
MKCRLDDTRAGEYSTCMVLACHMNRGPALTKAVNAWRVSLEARKLGSSSIIVRLSAIRKLAAEATGNGPLAAGISRVKSAKSTGIRVGNWLSLRQAEALPECAGCYDGKAPARPCHSCCATRCGLRRSAEALTFTHLQRRDGRWCIVDLFGKHGPVRTPS